MTEFEKVAPPTDGKTIAVQGGKLEVPDRPVIPYIAGDGTGPDIWKASQPVLDAAVRKAYGGRRGLAWFQVHAGESALELYPGSILPPDTLKAIRRYHVALKGPLTTPVGGGFRSLNVTLRQVLDLYACVRPVRWFQNVPSPVKDPGKVNMVVYRENTEDVYAGIEWPAGSPEAKKLAEILEREFKVKIPHPDSAIGIKPMSAFGSKRLIRKAIQYAIDRKRKSVTLMHKGNIQKYTEGAFRDWGYQLAKEEFADATISWDDVASKHGGKVPAGKVLIQDYIADVTFQHVLTRPQDFDVIATSNLNGDYVSDAIAAQVGGIGMAPGANISDFHAVFEATHGTAPKYANQDKVNPGSLTLSGVMMLDYMGWREAADMIEKAMEKTFSQKIVTYDLARLMEGAREVKTSEFATAVIDNL
ncbi:MAG: isocitrate dehydrogenase (NADP(+)) [Armatimonadetes bacterium]|nr:isocitrate dehydrogenase (NADP(+)) [Armatimonadota bacterium]